MTTDKNGTSEKAEEHPQSSEDLNKSNSETPTTFADGSSIQSTASKTDTTYTSKWHHFSTR